MDTITIKKKNEVWYNVTSDLDIRHELSDYLTFDVPNAKFNPKFKMGWWDGKIRLFNPIKSLLYIGLLSKLKDFCDERGYKLEFVDSAYGLPDETTNVTFDDIQTFVTSLDIHSGGKAIKPYDYQVQAVFTAIKNQRRIIQSSTGSGKSVMLYTICRYYSDKNKPCLLVCPSVQLVEQMTSDFADYASNTTWSAEDNVHKIYSGKEKDSDKLIYISTWQSLVDMSVDWFKKFQVVLVDEAQTAAAKSLTGILEKCENAKVRVGLSGSLGNSKTNILMIRALLGDVEVVATSKDLINKGHLTEIKISAIILDYSKETKLALKKSDYQTEIKFVTEHEKRNKFIRNLAQSLTGNTLILYNYVNGHGQLLLDLFNAKPSDKQVHYIHGGVKVEDREDIRALIETNNNLVIIASFGTTKQGINFKNLKNIIFAHPTKSIITVLQSIGRGLRKSTGKTHMHLYDIGDKLNNSKIKPNHTFNHFTQRLEMYIAEEFEYKLIEMVLEK